MAMENHRDLLMSLNLWGIRAKRHFQYLPITVCDHPNPPHLLDTLFTNNRKSEGEASFLTHHPSALH